LIFTSEAKSLFPLIAIITKIEFFIFALVKFIYQDTQLVGRDIGISILSALAAPLCFTSLTCYFFIVIKFLKSMTELENMSPEVQERVTKRFDLLTTFVYFIPPMSIVSCIIPLFGIGFPEYRDIFARASLIGCGVAAIIYGSIALNALDSLLVELAAHIDSFAQSDEDIKVYMYIYIYTHACMHVCI
jgi:hypothetical protein